jgi:hypothetical protein
LLILAQLGHKVPSTISSDKNSQYSIRQTLKILDDIADDGILNYRSMTDHKTIMAMKFMAKLEATIQQVRPELQPFITVKMLQLTVSEGLSSVSPIGFAYFSGMISRMGDLNNGKK